MTATATTTITAIQTDLDQWLAVRMHLRGLAVVRTEFWCERWAADDTATNTWHEPDAEWTPVRFRSRAAALAVGRGQKQRHGVLALSRFGGAGSR
jgi:hypothetical protein